MSEREIFYVLVHDGMGGESMTNLTTVINWIAGIITILSALLWLNEYKARRNEQLTRPIDINFRLTYLKQPQMALTAWDEIWKKMMPVCERGKDGKPNELQQQFSEDAKGSFFFAPEILDGKMKLSGYGFYMETLKTDSGAGIPVTFAFTCQSATPFDVKQLAERVEIPIKIHQHGGGNRDIEFDSSICLQAGKVCSDKLNIVYHGTPIAIAEITDSKPIQSGK